jgi:hypothetical protein
MRPAVCSERREAFYLSLAVAISAGEVNRRWIPDFLPENSRAIHIIYAPESPRTYCAFEFSPSDSQRLVTNLTNLDSLPPSVKHVQRSGVSWRPAVLRGDPDLGKFMKRGSALICPKTVRPLSIVMLCSLRLTGQRDVDFSIGSTSSGRSYRKHRVPAIEAQRLSLSR